MYDWHATWGLNRGQAGILAQIDFNRTFRVIFALVAPKPMFLAREQSKHPQAVTGRQKPTWTASPEDSLSSTVFGNEDDLCIGELLDFPLLIL